MNQNHEEESDGAPLEVVSASAVEAMERAAVDVQIATAKRYPRDIKRVKKAMLDFATMDQETAAECFYKLKRRDKDGKIKFIEGPSVRLAEIAVACYQNIRAGVRIVGNDGRQITAQGVCHDLENNISISWETKRRITGSNGRTFSDDLQVLTGNAASAIAFRNAVFKVIPGALITPVFEECKKKAVGSGKPIAERRAKMFEQFSKMGVGEDKILGFLEKEKADHIDDKDVETMLGVFNAIKEGTTSVDEQFNPKSDQPKPDAEALFGGGGKAQTAVLSALLKKEQIGFSELAEHGLRINLFDSPPATVEDINAEAAQKIIASAEVIFSEIRKNREAA